MLGLINRSPRDRCPYQRCAVSVSHAFGGIRHRSSKIAHQPAQGWTGAPTKDARSHVSHAFGGIRHRSSKIAHQPAQGWTGAPTKDARSHVSHGRGVCPYTPVNAEDMARLRVTLVASSLFAFLRVHSRFEFQIPNSNSASGGRPHFPLGMSFLMLS